MKVLEPGRPQKGWATEAICTGQGNGGGGCGAKLLVEQSDLFLTYLGDYGGGRQRFVSFRCQECKVETDLHGVPEHVAANLPARKEWLSARLEDAGQSTEAGK